MRRVDGRTGRWGMSICLPISVGSTGNVWRSRVIDVIAAQSMTAIIQRTGTRGRWSIMSTRPFCQESDSSSGRRTSLGEEEHRGGGAHDEASPCESRVAGERRFRGAEVNRFASRLG